MVNKNNKNHFPRQKKVAFSFLACREIKPAFMNKDQYFEGYLKKYQHEKSDPPIIQHPLMLCLFR
jgi:hypothetical protein